MSSGIDNSLTSALGRTLPFKTLARSICRQRAKSGHSNIICFYHKFICFNLSALAITETELRLIAAAAIIGESNNPING